MRPERQRVERIDEAALIRDAWYVLARARTQDAPRPLAVAQEAVFQRYLPMDRDLGKSPARNRRLVDPVDAEPATARGLAKARLGWRRPDSGRFEAPARDAIAAVAGCLPPTPTPRVTGHPVGSRRPTTNSQRAWAGDGPFPAPLHGRRSATSGAFC